MGYELFTSKAGEVTDPEVFAEYCRAYNDLWATSTFIKQPEPLSCGNKENLTGEYTSAEVQPKQASGLIAKEEQSEEEQNQSEEEQPEEETPEEAE